MSLLAFLHNAPPQGGGHPARDLAALYARFGQPSRDPARREALDRVLFPHYLDAQRAYHPDLTIDADDEWRYAQEKHFTVSERALDPARLATAWSALVADGWVPRAWEAPGALAFAHEWRPLDGAPPPPPPWAPGALAVAHEWRPSFLDHPGSFAEMRALAVDPMGIARAVALGHEVLRALRNWHPYLPDRVHLRVRPWEKNVLEYGQQGRLLLGAYAEPGATLENHAAWDDLRDRAEAHTEPGWQAVVRANQPIYSYLYALRRDLELEWIQAASRAQGVGGADANPWTPWLDLLATGYGPGVVTKDGLLLSVAHPGSEGVP